MPKHNIFKTEFSAVYPLYIAKVERKGRNKKEVDEIIMWLFGYSKEELDIQIESNVDFETFIKQSPCLCVNRKLIKGSVCGIKVEEIVDPLMQEIRYLDKLIDELAKGKSMDKILRKEI